jgi:predicted  nucleic acid-binding Zn-ribbon protein
VGGNQRGFGCGKMSKEFKEYIKTLQTRIANQRVEIANLRNAYERVEKECEKWKQNLEDFKDDIKSLLWFDIALTNEETQYLFQRIDETYGEYNEK